MSTAGELSGAMKRHKPAPLLERHGNQADVMNYRDPANGYERDPLGWYVEEPWTVEALWRFESARLDVTGQHLKSGIPEPVWDPACGAGNIPRTLGSLGLQTIGSDIVDRMGGAGHVRDFLTEPHEPHCSDLARAIVTNPPYGKLAERFVLRAIELVPYVAVLVQAKFPYSQGRYERLFGPHPPARLLHLVDRPSMPPGHLLGKISAQGGKMDFCWIIWDRQHAGPTTAHWLRRTR